MAFHTILNAPILKHVRLLLRGGAVWAFRYCSCGSKGSMAFTGYSLRDTARSEGDNRAFQFVYVL